MHEIDVKTEHGYYPIRIEPGIRHRIGEFLAPFNEGQRWVIFTHSLIWEIHGDAILSSIKTHGIDPEIIFVPEGESSKSLGTAEKYYSKLANLNCDRSAWLLAVGGGVIGDLTGFLAATYMRGVSFVQIPTSLLAMVDSSVGGKTGVNIPEGKNLVGAFYPPRMVIIDPEILKSLPPHEIISASAEIIKYGLISDPEFFHWFGDEITGYLEDNRLPDFSKAILHSCRIKAEIVSQDERETGLRQILNFGHTIGHALETLGGHCRLRHGEAVAYGMLCAAFISTLQEEDTGMEKRLSENHYEMISRTIRRLPLPAILPPEASQIIRIIKHDKKNRHGVLNFVLLEEPGKPVISTALKEEVIKLSLEQL